MEAIFDDNLIEVRFVHLNRGEQNRWHVNFAVVDGLRSFRNLFSLCKGNGGLRGFRCDEVNRLVDAHRLRPFDNPLARGQLGILPGYQHFSGEVLSLQRLDNAACCAIVGGDNGIDAIVCLCEHLLCLLQCIARLPVDCPVFPFRRQPNVARVNSSLQGAELSLPEELRVVICRCAAEQEVIPLRFLTQQVFRLQIAYLFVIKRDV